MRSIPESISRERPLIIDGGLATQLEAQGCDLNNRLWSAALLQSDPQAIVDASRAYLDAGAECIATASYQTSREGFGSVGLGADEADALMLLSVQLAERARHEYLRDNPDTTDSPLVAASIGPYGAMLHDGSEYKGDYGVSADTLRDFHAERLALFDHSGADILAVETIPSILEAEVLAELLKNCETPSWVSFSCRDAEHISDGSKLADAVRLFAGHNTVFAVGINCTPPQFAVPLIEIVRHAVPEKAVIAYPNSGEIYHVEDNSWAGTATPLDYASAAREWVKAGASIVGGCCRTTPEHIRQIRIALMQ
jgi:homocysteine S-methyltransferase